MKRVSKKYRQFDAVRMVDCPQCFGTGFKIWTINQRFNSPREERRFDCRECKGTGKVDAVEEMERILTK